MWKKGHDDDKACTAFINCPEVKFSEQKIATQLTHSSRCDFSALSAGDPGIQHMKM